MEVTPEQISQFHTQAEIDRRLQNSLASVDLAALERRALQLHPKPIRPMHVVPAEIRQGEVDFIASQIKREPTRKKHVLP